MENNPSRGKGKTVKIVCKIVEAPQPPFFCIFCGGTGEPRGLQLLKGVSGDVLVCENCVENLVNIYQTVSGMLDWKQA